MPPAKKRVGIREVRVGLLVVVAIGVLIFLILNASGDISPSYSKSTSSRPWACRTIATGCAAK